VRSTLKSSKTGARIAMGVFAASLIGGMSSIGACADAGIAESCKEVRAGTRTPTFWLSGCLANDAEMIARGKTSEGDKNEALLLLGAWGVLGFISFARLVKEEEA